MTLSIPDIDPDQDTISAALAYAKAGWYVLPVSRATKHAGSVLGKGWPAKTSRDPETIIAWFAGTDHALALHVGRSGAVCFDVDRPTELPPLLRAALLSVPGPMQSTREHDPERGHYLYAVPDGRQLGNSAGQLGKGWGEVRGKNGIIVVAPSEHEKAVEGGRYVWVRTGPLPLLPEVLSEQLPDVGDAEDAATDHEVKAFLQAHQGNARPELLHGVLRRFEVAVQARESRHNAMLAATVWAMREAAAGLYPAIEAARTLADAFTAVMRICRDGTERTLTRQQAHAEFQGILAWAIAQASQASPDEVRQAVQERAPRDHLSDLIAPLQPGPPPFADVTQDDEEQALYELLGASPADSWQAPAKERTSWWPRGLGNILAGIEEEPPPAFLERLDGARLFYAGKVNALLGESESGKTWVALLAVVQAITAGVRVVYLDFEDTPAGIVSRLRALGAPDDLILAKLSYIGPDEVLHATAASDLREHLDLVQPGLIILDGWNAAMTLLGLDLNSNTDATRFSQMLLKPLTASGAAVVAIDHVPKNKDARGKGGIGAQAKRAMLTGCAITVDVAEPFGRGMTGRLRLYVDKDRAGHVRAVAAEAKFAGTAILESDAATGKVKVSIRPPDMSTRIERENDQRASLKEAICLFLKGNPQAPLNAIKRGVEGNNPDIVAAVEELVASEHVVRQKRGQAYLHTVVRTYSRLEMLIAPVSGLPEPVTLGSVESDTQTRPAYTDLTEPARIGARLGLGSAPLLEPSPGPPLIGGPGSVEGADRPDAWILVDGRRVDPRTGEFHPDDLPPE